MISPAPLSVDVQSFNVEADKILGPFVSSLKAQAPPPIIYHYTNDAGLKGILEAGQLWFTDIFDLNDLSELNHGFSIMLKILMSEGARRSPQAKKFAEGLTAFNQRVGIQKTGNYFICSLSSCGNDLGQWRAYADNGRGYALGFDSTELEAAFTKSGDPWYAQASPVIYDDTQLGNLLAQLVTKLLDLISLPCSKEVLAQWYTYLTLHALNIGLHFKHMAYSNEQEYRFLEAHATDIPVPGVKLRPRRYSLVRYREFEWRKVAPGALKEIVVGPAAEPAQGVRFANECLRQFHSGTVKVWQSGLPYRAV